MRMQNERPDPIAQAMQMLQLVTQRRNQQGQMDLGNRELDLRQQQLAQQEALARMGMDLDRERFTSQNELGRDELNQRGSQFDQRLQFDQEQAPVERAYKQAIVDQIRARLQGNDQDPQMMALQEEQRRQAIAILQQELLNAPAIEQGRINDQIQAALQAWYGGMLPQRRPYNAQEQGMMNIFNNQQK